MITPQVQVLVNRAEESHQAAKVLLDKGFLGFSAAQSYYMMFYLTEALLHSKDFGSLRLGKPCPMAPKPTSSMTSPQRTGETDALDFTPYVETLADIIQTGDTPLTIAVFGTWGSGKTSLMKMV